jgi:hypothetical protein
VCACCCDEKGIAQQYMVQGVLWQPKTDKPTNQYNYNKL